MRELPGYHAEPARSTDDYPENSNVARADNPRGYGLQATTARGDDDDEYENEEFTVGYEVHDPGFAIARDDENDENMDEGLARSYSDHDPGFLIASDSGNDGNLIQKPTTNKDEEHAEDHFRHDPDFVVARDGENEDVHDLGFAVFRESTSRGPPLRVSPLSDITQAKVHPEKRRPPDLEEDKDGSDEEEGERQKKQQTYQEGRAKIRMAPWADEDEWDELFETEDDYALRMLVKAALTIDEHLDHLFTINGTDGIAESKRSISHEYDTKENELTGENDCKNSDAEHPSKCVDAQEEAEEVQKFDSDVRDAADSGHVILFTEDDQRDAEHDEKNEDVAEDAVDEGFYRINGHQHHSLGSMTLPTPTVEPTTHMVSSRSRILDMEAAQSLSQDHNATVGPLEDSSTNTESKSLPSASSLPPAPSATASSSSVRRSRFRPSYRPVPAAPARRDAPSERGAAEWDAIPPAPMSSTYQRAAICGDTRAFAAQREVSSAHAARPRDTRLALIRAARENANAAVSQQMQQKRNE